MFSSELESFFLEYQFGFNHQASNLKSDPAIRRELLFFKFSTTTILWVRFTADDKQTPL